MWIWVASSFAFLGSLFYFMRAIAPVWRELISDRVTISEFERGAQVLRDLSECLEAGVLPSEHQWGRLNRLDTRVRDVVIVSIQCLRDSGAPIVPTLKRFRSWCEKQAEIARFASARSASSLMQALVIAALVPFASVFLSYALELSSSHRIDWLIISSCAFIWASLGALSILIQADRAKWAGLLHKDRGTVSQALAFAEMLIAQLQSGLPGDLAWSRARELMFAKHSASAVDVIAPTAFTRPEREVRWVSPFLSSMQNSIAAALVDGRAATDRIMAHVANFESDFRFQVSREIEALSVRALKPLYVFAFPSILVLVVSALALTVNREFSIF